MNELLRQLIEDLGISRSQFAKKINMDRSQVVKTINGNLPVSKRFFMSIMGAQFISDDFKEKFSSEYGKESAVNNHNKIIEKFFAELKQSSETTIAGKETELGQLIYSQVSDAFARGKMVYAVCMHEHISVEKALQRALKETGSKTLKRICPVSFVLSETMIEELFDIAVFACHGIQTYITKEQFNGLFPFGVFSDSFAVAFDTEGHYAVIEDKMTCVSLMQKYNRMAESLYGTVVFIEDESQTLLRSADLNYGAESLCIYNHFSPVGLIDYNMLRTVANPELNEDIRDNLIRATISEYESRANEMDDSVYTSGAIEDFVKTGRIAAISYRYIRPFAVSSRIEMLRRLCNMIKNDKASIIKTDTLRFSGDIYINRNGIDLCVCGDQSLRSDLYCAHIYLQNDRILGLEEIAKAIKTQLPLRNNMMSKIGAEYYLNSLIASLGEMSSINTKEILN